MRGLKHFQAVTSNIFRATNLWSKADVKFKFKVFICRCGRVEVMECKKLECKRF